MQVVCLFVCLLLLESNVLSLSLSRYRIADLITQKLLKEHEDFLMPKIVLSLCIQLGLRGNWDTVIPEMTLCVCVCVCVCACACVCV